MSGSRMGTVIQEIFDEDTKASFLDLYTKSDAAVLTSEDTATEDTEEFPF